MNDTYDPNDPRSVAQTKRLVLGIAGAVLLALIAAAAVGVPWFLDYSKRNRVEEAHGNVGALRSGMVRYCEQNGAYPPPTGPLPARPSKAAQRVDFRADPTFSAISFDPGSLVFYSYAIESDGDGARIIAQGDLDGDGVLSTWLVNCRAGCVCDLPLIRAQSE